MSKSFRFTVAVSEFAPNEFCWTFHDAEKKDEVILTSDSFPSQKACREDLVYELSSVLASQLQELIEEK